MNHSTRPVVSIITPSFNCASYIQETIESILRQSYPRIEYIVVDGGSTDGSKEIIETYRDRISIFISEPDNGMYDALRKGFAVATGDIVCYLNSDDLLHRNAVAEVVRIFNQFEDIHWLTGHIASCHENGLCFASRLPPPYSIRLLRSGLHNAVGYPVPQESTFWRRSMLEGLDLAKFATLKYAGDAYLWSHFSRTQPLHLVDAQLAMFRVRSGQLSGVGRRYYQEALKVETTNGLQRSWARLIRLTLRLPRRMKLALCRRAYILYSARTGRWFRIKNLSLLTILFGELS